MDRRTVAGITVLLVGAAGLGVGGGLLFGDDGGEPAQPVASPATATSPAPTAVPTTTAPSGPPVPVYVLGEAGGGPKLYREFRPRSATDPVAAVVTWLAEAPADPDYRSPWAGVEGRATRSGRTVTVRFTAAPDLGTASPALALQQVVYTVTAADPSVAEVAVLAPGLPTAATTRAAQGDVLAPVWLLDPVDGGTAGAPLAISGTASVFEATVSIQVRRGSKVVARTTATASEGAPGRGDWKARIQLPAGDYVVEAYEVSEKDGARVAVDSKRVTVR